MWSKTIYMGEKIAFEKEFKHDKGKIFVGSMNKKEGKTRKQSSSKTTTILQTNLEMLMVMAMSSFSGAMETWVESMRNSRKPRVR